MLTSVVELGDDHGDHRLDRGAGPSIMGIGAPGWRLSCIAGTVFGFISTLALGLTQQFKLSDRLAQRRKVWAG